MITAVIYNMSILDIAVLAPMINLIFCDFQKFHVSEGRCHALRFSLHETQGLDCIFTPDLLDHLTPVSARPNLIRKI